MLHEPTQTKLHAMKLTGMAEAYEEQRAQSRSAELSFEERFGLLVERQWLWRENRVLVARLRHARLKQPGLHRRPRFQFFPRLEACRHRSTQPVRLGEPSPERHHHRPHRLRQNLRRLCPGSQSLPRGPPGLVLLRAQVDSRPQQCGGRWQLDRAAQEDRQNTDPSSR